LESFDIKPFSPLDSMALFSPGFVSMPFFF
jgi:hypothetical protein